MGMEYLGILKCIQVRELTGKVMIRKGIEVLMSVLPRAVVAWPQVVFNWLLCVNNKLRSMAVRGLDKRLNMINGRWAVGQRAHGRELKWVADRSYPTSIKAKIVFIADRHKNLAKITWDKAEDEGGLTRLLLRDKWKGSCCPLEDENDQS